MKMFSMNNTSHSSRVTLFSFLFSFVVLTISGCGGGGGSKDPGTTFELTIENISTDKTFTTQAGTTPSIAFSPGIFVVHHSSNPIFTPGTVAGNGGLESLAEDGDVLPLSESLQSASTVSLIGVVLTPIGESGAGILLPGKRYRSVFTANRGEKLSLVLSFLLGNDIFVGNGNEGVDLFTNDYSPRSGEITHLFSLWDAGTEINEPPGTGENQVAFQREPDTGASESNEIQLVSDGFKYPALGQMLKITITELTN